MKINTPATPITTTTVIPPITKTPISTALSKDIKSKGGVRVYGVRF